VVRYIGGLIIQRIVTLFFIALITFLLMHAVPGGPFEVRAGDRVVSPEFIAQQEAFYGLDDSMPEQFGTWLWNMVQGDLGLSFTQLGRSVEDIIVDGMKPSAILGGMAFVLVMAVGIPLGIISAIRANTRFDYASVGVSTIFGAVPSFILAFLLLLIFSVWLDVFPIRLGKGFGDSFDSLRNGILPALALGAPSMAILVRLTRGAMLEVLSEDYIRTARAKGLASRTVYVRHALRNALVPILTLAGPTFAFLITGSIIIENIFGLPGIGNAFVSSIFNRDFGVIMGTTMFFATLIVFVNLLVDLSYPFIDPRVKLGSRV
jgi:oligopeptide transport system permease protein